MHPILKDKRRLGIYLVGWIPAGGLLAALLVVSDTRAWGEALAVALPLALVYAFLSLASWFVCRSVPLESASAPRIIASHAVAAVVSSAFWLLLGKAWTVLLASFFDLAQAPGRFDRDRPLFFLVGILLFVLAAAVHYLLIAFEASREAQRRALELQVLAREAQLEALKAQINPHFLFNSLNSISALAGSDPASARRMCLLLADFLRRSLKLGAKEQIPLAEELAFADCFLAVEQVRFGPRLRVEKRVDSEAERCLIPPLLLQPLVENAVNHGIASLVDGGIVRLEAGRRGERLEIAIENPCEPDRPASRGQGVGLANVKARLGVLHPKDSSIEVIDNPRSFRVTLSFPAVFAAAGNGAVDGARDDAR